MIYLYSGTPGSGKSLHATYDIYTRLLLGKHCIANFPIDFTCRKGRKLKKDRFLYLPNEDISVRTLIKESLRVSQQKGFKENNILWVVDEAGCVWNSRQFQNRDRLEWIRFFSQHRHFGYNIILVSQTERMLDRQIRGLIEYEVEHRKANNFKLFKLLPFPVFISIERWHSVNEKIESNFFMYNRQKAKLYNSYATYGEYDSILEELQNELEVKQDGQEVHGDTPGSGTETVDRVCDVEGQADGIEKEGTSGEIGPGTEADHGEDGPLEMGA